MTLIDLALNTEATIKQIRATHFQVNKLYALGIYIDAVILKRHHLAGKGPIVICTQQQCSFAIGHDLAANIEVAV